MTTVTKANFNIGYLSILCSPVQKRKTSPSEMFSTSHLAISTPAENALLVLLPPQVAL